MRLCAGVKRALRFVIKEPAGCFYFRFQNGVIFGVRVVDAQPRLDLYQVAIAVVMVIGLLQPVQDHTAHATVATVCYNHLRDAFDQW